MNPHRRNLYFKTYHNSSTRIPRQWAISVQQYYLISTTKMTVKYASLDVPRACYRKTVTYDGKYLPVY